ncbi:fasciclin domain-containing protein [Rufibacter latericius]|uniref:Fasciclin domain-containing protein n=1 Tax=Rufibacter latericius TaxID=2487040 RepID=A0A3M9MN67_9BACT|nr:fasciclin domain-containing protein [Rufibacter latericius]RNI26982.1 fasciclin domain-containing protein [Rufibacter latericius]
MLNFTKICLVFCLCFGLLANGWAQSMVAKVASATKVTNMSLAEGIAQKDRTLLDLVTKAGLMPVLSGAGEYTFFAPSSATIAQHQNDSPDQLKTFLEQHIVQGTLTSDDLRDGADLKTLNGNNLRICRKKGNLMVSGVRLLTTDQQYMNGVWHQLNGTIQSSTSNL